jgi:hypothetical protein
MDTIPVAIKKHTAVWTDDHQCLGDAMHIYHRLDEVNRALKLYAAYLETFSFEMGEHYYIPTDFVADYDEGNGRLALTVSRKEVEEQTWHRMPSFVATGKARKEELPT